MLEAIRCFYHRLIQRRALAEPHFGQPRAWQRLWRIRWLSALFLALPALALVAWYSYSAVVAHYRHVIAIGEKEPLTFELFHLHLHDRLKRDERRLLMPPPAEDSPLPTYGLVLSNDDLDRLGKMLPPGEGRTYYVNGHLTRGSDVYEIEVRYRGGKHWNWNHPQKSWKVRMQGEQLFDGRATFNFLNTPEPMPFDEHLILEIADELGLLSPEYYPVRLLLNRNYMGIYFFETQPDEGTLRQDGRVPGSIYSGNEAPLDPDTLVSSLWKSADRWTKVSAVEPSGMDDRSELAALLQAVNSGSPSVFEDFAHRYIDVEKFALFDALDVVFGVDQHDFDQNHKLYFDPYKGRFEPIAWNFRGAEHERELNRTENPLLLRLKQLPGYISTRNAKVYHLLRGACSVESLRGRVDRLLAQLEHAQARDPYWDAYELLPDLGDYYDEMLRPMNRSLQSRAVAARLEEQAKRERFVLEVLSRQEMSLALQPWVEPGVGILDLAVDGSSGYALRTVTADWEGDCQPDEWLLVADTNLSGALELEADRVFAHGDGEIAAVHGSLHVFPGVRLEPRTLHPRRGAVKTVPAENTYRFFVVGAGCRVSRARVEADSLVTGEPLTVESLNQSDSREPVEAGQVCVGMGAWPAAGERSAHPWCYRQRKARHVELGPGVVPVSRTIVYDSETSVTIAPGTTLEIADGASLLFHGRVVAEGTRDAPIRFQAGGARWGGVALQGRGTAGSRLRFVEIRGGSRPAGDGMLRFEGLLNIHDTSNIQLAHIHLSESASPGAALHAAYVEELQIADSKFNNTAADALDIDHSAGDLTRIEVVDAGGDAIRLRGARFDIRGAVFIGWKGSAIAAGEESQVVVQDSLLANGARGLSIQNASTVTVLGSLLYRNDVGVRLEPVSQAYPGKSHLRGDALFAVQCAQQVQAVNRKLKRIGRIANQIGDGDLEGLRVDTLDLGEWDELDEWIAARSTGRRP